MVSTFVVPGRPSAVQAARGRLCTATVSTLSAAWWPRIGSQGWTFDPRRTACTHWPTRWGKAEKDLLREAEPKRMAALGGMR